ncbi:hypothetical protein CR983_03725 [Candidatus Saccharibacteria bacterium]|nr:MAG: hypothetical protein CR983_03725 [Candidatus Saccharibacteria bacterium]
MYLQSRGQAGKMIAAQLMEKYRYENCAVVALSDASVLVAEQIAADLHCVLTLLLSEKIEIPGEDLTLGSVSQTGEFSYNQELTQGEADGYTREFHGYFEEQKREAFGKLNRLLGDGGTIDADLLRDRVVILVSDGIAKANILDVALTFLKPIRVEKIVIAAPFVSVAAVDVIHVKADDMCILDVKENYLATDHYYEDNVVPDREETIRLINELIMKWR